MSVFMQMPRIKVSREVIMKKLVRGMLPVIDLVLAPFVLFSAWLLEKYRKYGIKNLTRCRSVLFKTGVFPIRNHYYEPQFDFSDRKIDFSADRDLPGIDWNVSGQLEWLQNFNHSDELNDLPQKQVQSLEFYLENGAFESGDAEYWYQIIRKVKPKRIFEIGSGNSTLMAIRAINANRQEDPAYECDHLCVEPFEMPWLEQAGVKTVRKMVEELDVDFFANLQENDILFIDSSHMIRPQGDVVFESLQLLPTLNKGVIVHVHDIFSPKNYPEAWLVDEVRFWNEQYLLEAFLTHNRHWEIIGALNFLRHNHFSELKRVAPYITSDREPGSFYLRKLV